MKYIFTISLLFLTKSLLACSCITLRLAQYHDASDFIATAKVLKISPDPKDDRYHNIEVSLIAVYKGKPTTALRVFSFLKSSCAFYTPENSHWLIFAKNDRNGIPTFGFCSGSLQIDRQFDHVQYPTLAKSYKSTIAIKLDVLRFLKEQKILSTNSLNFNSSLPKVKLDALKDFKGKNKDFAVYKIDVNKDLTIENIKAIRKFKNNKLTAQTLKTLQQYIEVKTEKTNIPEKTILYLIYYYYPADKENKSFVSIYDL